VSDQPDFGVSSVERWRAVQLIVISSRKCGMSFVTIAPAVQGFFDEIQMVENGNPIFKDKP